MKRVLIWTAVLILMSASAAARESELTLYPAKAVESAARYRLLPKPDDQTESDAHPLYEKAIQALPEDFEVEQTKQLRRWMDAPLSELPQDDVEALLERAKPTVVLLDKAAKCKRCKWPSAGAGPSAFKLMENLSNYRRLAFMLAVRARFYVARSEYDAAIESLQSGLAMARFLAQAPVLTQGLVGAGVAALMFRQVEQFVQRPDAPSIYRALEKLPRPIVDLTRQLEREELNALTPGAPGQQLGSSLEKVRLQMKGLDQWLAGLQCIEALRLHAGTHGGKWPAALSDITELALPDDPLTTRPFAYRSNGSKGVLEGGVTEARTGARVLRYKLNLKE